MDEDEESIYIYIYVVVVVGGVLEPLPRLLIRSIVRGRPHVSPTTPRRDTRLLCAPLSAPVL